MTRTGRLALAVLAGAFTALGQAPYDLPFAMLLGLAAAFWLFSQAGTARQAALLGWAFGTGYFAHALQWIVSPFMVDAARHGWMAPFALVFLAAGLALFWGAAFWLARRLEKHRGRVLILTWSAAELLRAYVFTGFPWAMPSQALINSMAGQALAFVGPYALNLILLAIAALLVAVTHRQGARAGLALAIVGVLAISVPIFRSVSATTSHTLRLIQPNAAQRDKWDPAKIPVFYNRQLEYTAAAPLGDGPLPDLVIWSETAIPWSLELADSVLKDIAAAGGRATVALGAQRSEGLRFYNSMVSLGPEGAAAQVYDKHHLVPFGEYMPLGDLLANFGIYGLASRAGNGYSAGPGATLMNFGALGKALPLICYEAVFAHDVNAAPERPSFLIQITNDAWFGKGAGPKQHLAQARMRAIEQGLPLARSANTGISAMIDPHGRVTASLPLNTAGFVDAVLPAPLPPTIYSRTGDLPFTGLLLLALLATGLRARWS